MTQSGRRWDFIRFHSSRDPYQKLNLIFAYTSRVCWELTAWMRVRWGWDFKHEKRDILAPQRESKIIFPHFKGFRNFSNCDFYCSKLHPFYPTEGRKLTECQRIALMMTMAVEFKRLNRFSFIFIHFLFIYSSSSWTPRYGCRFTLSLPDIVSNMQRKKSRNGKMRNFHLSLDTIK